MVRAIEAVDGVDQRAVNYSVIVTKRLIDEPEDFDVFALAIYG